MREADPACSHCREPLPVEPASGLPHLEGLPPDLKDAERVIEQRLGDLANGFGPGTTTSSVSRHDGRSVIHATYVVDPREHLRDDGIAGVATIIRIREKDLGEMEEQLAATDDRVLDMTLRVEIPARPPYRVTTTQVVHGRVLKWATAGSRIAVRVDPERHRRLLVVEAPSEA